MRSKLTAAVVLSAALLMTGCASVPMASKGADAKAKQFAPSQGGVADLYIYRNELFGSAVKMPLLIDGTSVGDTVAHTYVFKTLPAGQHTITSKTENDASLTINMVAGQTYFVWQEVKMGVLAARSALHQVDEATGEAGVKECNLVEGDSSAEAALAAAPVATPVAASATAAVATSPTPMPTAKPMVADPSPQPVVAAEPAQPPAPIASVSARDSAASATMAPNAQSVATEMGCGAVQANGASTFVASCGSYSVLIDCDGGQCRPMHTVNVQKDE